MKLAIVGKRDPKNPADVKRQLEQLIDQKYGGKVTEIVSGGARGVDTIAMLIADERGVTYREFPADWKAHGRAAGPIRNKQIIAYADEVVACPDRNPKVSPGTMNSIRHAQTMGKPLTVLVID